MSASLNRQVRWLPGKLRTELTDATMDSDRGAVTPVDEGSLTVFYWHEEPDYESAWWWDDDYAGPTEEP
jgi:hypothetical protein